MAVNRSFISSWLAISIFTIQPSSYGVSLTASGFLSRFSFAEIPVIFFPGGISQLNSHYDALLFMSIISGRNPHYLIGEQVIAAPIINDLGIEVIPTGYLLLDGGSNSAVQFMSGTAPIPMDKPDISIAHALAAQYLGKQLIYLESI